MHMPRRPRKIFRSTLLGPFLVALLSTSVLEAQLDIPRGGGSRGQRGEGAELPNKPRKPGTFGRGNEGAGGLDLPEREGGPVGVLQDPDGYTPDPAGRARFLVDQVKRERKLESAVVEEATEGLVLLGDVGRDAARTLLATKSAPSLATGVRVLLRVGGPQDRQRVVERLRRKVPTKIASVLLRELAEANPVLTSPEFLIELLGHPTGGMRTAAQRMLDGKLEVSHFAHLNELLGSKQRDTRLRAVELLATLDDPAVERVLTARLSDKAPNVARAAAAALAMKPGDVADALLLERAFRVKPIDRGGAYALIAIVDREDRSGRALLSDEHVERLRPELRNTSLLVAGAAACSMAGIGFRSERSTEYDWLDLSVPHQLVRVSSGAEFHKDFGSLQEPAQRRLELLSGESFGTDGARWTQWWKSGHAGFRARRAIIELQPG